MPTNVRIVKAMVFLVVMYRSENFLAQGLNPVLPNCRQILYHPSQQGSPCRCENGTIKQAECQKTDALKLRCWIRLFRVPWTARRSNQSILKGNQLWMLFRRTDAEADAPILWHFMRRADSLEKTLMLGKIEGMRRKRRQKMKWMASWLNGHEVEETSGDREGQGSLGCRSWWSWKKSDTTATKQQMRSIGKLP